MAASSTCRNPRSARSRESAFTLIELLSVMIIIAVLIAIAVPTFLSQKSAATKTQLTMQIKLMQNALEACSAAKNLDGSYMGCAEHDYLWEFEPSVKDIPKCCPTPARIPGAFDINGISATNQIIWVPGRTEPVAGYEIDTWMHDGGTMIWFQLAHWPDGSVTRHCGEGNRPSSFAKDKPPGVKYSRVCKTGTW